MNSENNKFEDYLKNFIIEKPKIQNDLKLLDAEIRKREKQIAQFVKIMMNLSQNIDLLSLVIFFFKNKIT